MIDGELKLIERFFDKALNESELQDFGNRLDNEEAFVKQVARYEYALNIAKRMYSHEETIAEDALKEHWKKKLKPDTFDSKKWLFRKWFSLAASLLFMLSVAAWLFLPAQEHVTPDELFIVQLNSLENFNKDYRGVEDGKPSNMQILTNAFIEKDFEKIITIARSNKNLLPEEKLIVGRAFVQTDQYQESIIYFKDVLDSDSVKWDEATWNLAFVYYKMNELEQSRFYLGKILNEESIPNGHMMKKNATIIMQTLEGE